MPSGGDVYAVKMPVASLYRRPSTQSPKDTELLFGAQFLVIDTNDGWAEGQEISPVPGSDIPGYKGYVPIDALAPFQKDPTHIVTGLSAPVFERADIKSPVSVLWPMTARFVGEDYGDFVQSSFGFVHKRHVRALTEDPTESDFVAIAERFTGLPYIWAGVSSFGLDCSGLVQTALRAVGRDAFRDSSDQVRMGCEVPNGASLQRGDLVFWKGHVGIMQDEHNLLHANAYHMKVASEPLQEAVERIQKHYGPVTARRRL